MSPASWATSPRWMPMRNQMPDLDKARADEADLMRTFDERQKKAWLFWNVVNAKPGRADEGVVH